jgi:hypothetical protein
MSAVTVVLVVAIVVVINVITGILMNRYPLKLDLTSDKRFELCDETIDALKSLDEDIEIGVTYPKDTLLQYSYYQMIPEILERYSIYAKEGNGSVSIRYFDVNEDPDIVAKYNQYYSGTISTGAMVVYCEEEERAEVLSISGMISSSSSSSYYSTSSDASYSFTGENSITSAILNVTDANPVRAGFLINMGDDAYVFGDSGSVAYAVSSYESLLSKNGYECTELDIQSDKITPDDYDLIVIPAPFYDFNEDIIDDLEEFLYNDGNYGKNIVYIAHPTQTSDSLPNITEFLAKHSLKVEDSIIKDYTTAVGASLYASSYESYPSALVSVADSDSVGTLTSESLPIAVPDSRSVTILDKNTGYVTTEILKTADTAALLSLEDQTLADETASYVVAAKSTDQHQDNYDINESSVMVIGSIFMFDPMLIQYNTTYNNSNVTLNMTNVVCDKDSGVIIPDKTLDDNVIALTSTQQRVIRNIVIFGIPLIIVVIGAVVFIRRRNR